MGMAAATPPQAAAASLEPLVWAVLLAEAPIKPGAAARTAPTYERRTPPMFGPILKTSLRLHQRRHVIEYDGYEDARVLVHRGTLYLVANHEDCRGRRRLCLLRLAGDAASGTLRQVHGARGGAALSASECLSDDI